MGKKMLHVSFKYDFPEEHLSAALMEKAEEFAAVDGLDWKLWFHDPKKKTVGGVYLFKDEKSLDAYLGSELFQSLDKHPDFLTSDWKISKYNILTEHSKITRGPI